MMREAHHVATHRFGDASGEAASTHPSRRPMSWEPDIIIDPEISERLALGRERQWKVFGAKEYIALNDLNRAVLGPVDVGEALNDPLQGDLHFQTCQGCAEAEMNAVPEGHMPVWVAANIKAFRRLKCALVKVICQCNRQYPVAFLNGLISHCYPGCGDTSIDESTGRDASWGYTAQDLFDR